MAIDDVSEANEIVRGGEDGENVVTLLNLVVVKFLEVLAQTLRAKGVSGIEAVKLVASGEHEGNQVAADKAIVSTSDTNEGINFVGKRRSEVEWILSGIDLTTLNDTATESNTHGVRDDVDFFGASVSKHSFRKCAQVLQVLFGVDLVLSLILVTGAPCGDVHFALLVTLSEEVLNGL